MSKPKTKESTLPESFLVKETRIKRVLEVLSKFDVVFKGGTSLSLTYGIIDRFSEDIDVSFYLESDNKENRKATRVGILSTLKEEAWIESIEEVGSDIMIHFKNNAPSSEFDAAIKPGIIKLELQNVEKKRTKVIASRTKPYSEAEFEMNVALPFSTFVDKTALMFELTIEEKLPKLIDDTKTLPRHLYDYLKICKYLQDKGENKTISSYTKYVEYCKQRIAKNILLSDGVTPRDRYNKTLWSTHVLKGKSVFKTFETYIRANKDIILNIINSVVYPSSRDFTVPSFLKAVKVNFNYYEKLLKEMLEQNTKTQK